MRPHHSPFNPPFLFIACKHIKPMRKLIFDSLNFDASSFLEIQVKIHKSCLTREKKMSIINQQVFFYDFKVGIGLQCSTWEIVCTIFFLQFNNKQTHGYAMVLQLYSFFVRKEKCLSFIQIAIIFFLFHFTILATVSFHSCHLHIHL